MNALQTSPTVQPVPAAPGLDVERIRPDFPILKLQVNGRQLVYLDNAASSQMPQQVIDRLVRYQTTQHANINRAVHTLSEIATNEYEQARRKLQHFIHAREEREVIFTSGTTDAINLVMHGYGRKFIGPGDEIILTTMEHHSNIVPWQMLAEEKGATIRVVPINDAGELVIDDYEKLFNERTKFVGVMHVSNALGTINPIKQMIAFAHARGVPVLVDGAQAVPHMKVDVQDLDCDFYAFSGHKLCGPTGIGILFGKAALPVNRAAACAALDPKMKRRYASFSRHEQKSSTNQPGSPGRLATLARGLGWARLRSMPSRSSATSPALSSPRRHTAPSRRNAATCSSSTIESIVTPVMPASALVLQPSVRRRRLAAHRAAPR